MKYGTVFRKPRNPGEQKSERVLFYDLANGEVITSVLFELLRMLYSQKYLICQSTVRGFLAKFCAGICGKVASISKVVLLARLIFKKMVPLLGPICTK